MFRDGWGIYLCEGDQGQPGTWVWIGVEDVQVLHEELRAKGGRIVLPPTNFAHALEMRVEDPDGHVLRIGSMPMPGASDSSITPLAGRMGSFMSPWRLWFGYMKNSRRRPASVPATK